MLAPETVIGIERQWTGYLIPQAAQGAFVAAARYDLMCAMSAYIKEGTILTLHVADDKQILIADTKTEVVTGFGHLRTVTDTDPGAIEDARLLPLIIRLIYIVPGLEGPGAGKYLAQWMVRRTADINMRDFDPRRFGNWIDRGQVSSGGFGFTTGKSLAFAYVKPECARPGTELSVMILGEHRPARVLELPVYDPENRLPRA